MECSYEDIYKIAGYDLDWMCVGRGLLNDQKVRESDHEGSIEGGKRDKVFLKWKRTMSRKVGYNATADLEELERKAQASCIQNLNHSFGALEFEHSFNSKQENYLMAATDEQRCTPSFCEFTCIWISGALERPENNQLLASSIICLLDGIRSLGLSISGTIYSWISLLQHLLWFLQTTKVLLTRRKKEIAHVGRKTYRGITWSTTTNTHFLMILFLLKITCATCSVILSPQGNYTVFQSTYPVSFNCSGDGTIAVWTLNGNSSSGSGVNITPYDPKLGAVVPSYLSIIPYPTYNNTQVACAVVTYQPTLRFLQSSPTLLIIQGPLDIPRNFFVNKSNTTNTTFFLSWGAPFSLDVTDSPDIFYYTLCTNITIYGCRNISSDPDCTFPRTCTSSVDFTDHSLNGTNGGQNKTIMEIHFTFFAVNGAGNGTSAYTTYSHFPQKKLDPNAASSQTEATTELFDPTNPSAPANRAYNQTSAIVGCIIGGVALVAIVAFFLVLMAILCAKKNARNRLPPTEVNNYIQTPSKEETDYFVTLNTFVPHLQHHSGSESGYQDVYVTTEMQVSIISLPVYENVLQVTTDELSYKGRAMHQMKEDLFESPFHQPMAVVTRST